MDEAKKGMAWGDEEYEAQLAGITDERAKNYIKQARTAFKTLMEYADGEEGWKKSEEKSGV